MRMWSVGSVSDSSALLDRAGEVQQGAAALLRRLLPGQRLLVAWLLRLLHFFAQLVEGAGEAADLGAALVDRDDGVAVSLAQLFQRGHRAVQRRGNAAADRKSTRLNSSH